MPSSRSAVSVRASCSAGRGGAAVPGRLSAAVARCSARSGCRSRSVIEHLQRAFTRPQNYAALVNTLQLALGTGIMSVLIGVPLAWATARSDMPLRHVVHALVALSYITPPYLTALAYIILLGPDAGQFNRLLRAVFGFESGPINIFSMRRRHLRHRHPRLRLHLLSHLQRAAVGRRLARGIGADAGRQALADDAAHQSAAGRAGDHRRRAAVGDQFARPVRAAGHHRHAGADRVPADAHLRHHRQLPAALGRGVRAVARARRADGRRACAAARLSGAALLHHGRRARRAHQDTSSSASGAGRCWPSA